MVHTAYSQMGKKYRLGGASPQKGFDCSGLIWWAYRQNGLNVPRITVDQARAGQSVPKNLARPGDIVVFRTGQSPRGLHTGIYAGGDSFIHSPRRGERVRMESMNIPYWRSKLISVRRVVR
ncbi:MAG: C40 family peptidase [Desulfovibrio sp.]|uniref:C40 family peptidase n=1 Tax=Desulfovibrio porci TaxID=2605782 RepID=UPI0025840CE5|nr:C40 family peptidase [Desulfovibrio porci]MCD7984790.1 C40 family peptidase [Desulfovibrio sp.]MDY3809410.1 C40 family peptidase [Desulfovibrio porci]